jgi:hypothetical protein
MEIEQSYTKRENKENKTQGQVGQEPMPFLSPVSLDHLFLNAALSYSASPHYSHAIAAEG